MSNMRYRKKQWGKSLLIFHTVIMVIFWAAATLLAEKALWDPIFLFFSLLMLFLLLTTRDCVTVILTDHELEVFAGLWGLKAKRIPLEDVDFMERFDIPLPILLTRGGLSDHCLAVGKKGLRVTRKTDSSFVFSSDDGENLIRIFEAAKSALYKEHL